MTSESRERLARYRSGEPYQVIYTRLSDLIGDLEAEREAVLQILLPACHSGTNLRTHDAIYRALVLYGERPEGEER